MDKELDKKLCEDFPNLYRDRYAPMNKTSMCWGFPGNGWEPIIRDISQKLENIILSYPEQKRENCKAVQIKEKFGSLRIYLSWHSEEISEIIKEAVELSGVTCEYCGKLGEIRGKYWQLCLCDDCEKKRYSQE